MNDDPRLRSLFESLRSRDSQSVAVASLLDAIREAGLRESDPRLRTLFQQLRAVGAAGERGGLALDRPRFDEVVRTSGTLAERIIRRDLALPAFGQFRDEVVELFDVVRQDRSGRVASYIPQLARVEPEQSALGLCTVDGQRMALGDSDVAFCLQSSCKPVNYLLALEDEGAETVHRHIGREPSGHSFNELSLNVDHKPHNPMINAGAIMACSLIGRSLEPSDRFDHVTSTWMRLTGGTRPRFDNATYLSERKTADRNYALGYFMREHKAFPEHTDLTATLEFYFQCCSLELNVDEAAVVAATLANGGICPITDDQVFSPEAIQKCLSMMYSCGMYDYSGEWAFTIGLPAKSGVSGIILVIVPNTMGLAIWSPRLDRHGNSVQGIGFCREFVRRYNFHHYDHVTSHASGKKDPRREPEADHGDLVGQLLWSASKGDVGGMQSLVARGVDPSQADYDGRTALHLAASEGRTDAVRYLLDQGVETTPRDRWGGTALVDAEREGHDHVAELLRETGSEP